MATTRNKSKTQRLLKDKNIKTNSIPPPAAKARQSLTKEHLKKHNTEYIAHGNSLLPSKSKKITAMNTYTTEMTPRKSSRIKEFQDIDSWELEEELVLF